MGTSKRSRKFTKRTTVRAQKVSTLEQDITSFLGVLCVEWGFCIAPDDAKRIAQLDRVTAEQFASLVLEAEGISSDTSPWFKKISNRFFSVFGDEAVAATYQDRSA